MLALFKPKLKKVIYHVGAWAGNFGDSILQGSIKRQLEKVFPYRLEFRYLNCQKTEFTKPLIDEINAGGNLLIVGGGGLIFYRPSDNSKSGWQWNIELGLIDEIKIPLVIYGVGYNQFEYDPSNFLLVTNANLQKVVEKAALFSVRNSGSKRELIKRGCNGSKIEVIPDSGMFLKARRKKVPGLKRGQIKIGFNWTTDREDQTFPAPFQANRAAFINNCISVLNYAIEKYHAQIVYIGHMSKDFDANIIGILKSRLSSPPIVIDEVFKHFYPASVLYSQYIADIYRQMDVVLGMRGHSNIVSFGQNTPHIGLGSHGKIRYFLEDTHRSQYWFDVREGKATTLEQMRAILDDVIKNRLSQKKTMKAELAAQYKIYVAFNKKVINLLNRETTGLLS